LDVPWKSLSNFEKKTRIQEAWICVGVVQIMDFESGNLMCS
jgi:hypothetical protein